MDSPKCIEYIYPGAPKQSIDYPLVLTAHASYQYYEPRQGFNLFGIFKNPMLLMMLVMGGMMVLMPKMMEGLDPEQKEQMQKQMELQQDPTKVREKVLSSLFYATLFSVASICSSYLCLNIVNVVGNGNE